MRKKIPTLIGLFLVIVLLGGLAVTTQLTQKLTNFFPQASSENTLILSPAAANVSDKNFTVYWITANSGDGAVFYGTTTSVSDGVVKDEPGQTHFVQISNLKPGTKYYFRVVNQPTQEITTLTGLPVISPVYGKIADGAGVLAVSGNFAALSKDDGSFLIPVVGPAEKVTLYRPNQPPTIYNPSSSAPIFTTPSGGLEVNLQDNSTVSTPLPTISGKAGPNQVVKIVIHSDQAYNGQVMADPAGNWTWTPPAGLSPGQHTATITINNADGTTQTVTRTFTVPAGGSILPITSGTPSAQPVVQPSLSPPPPLVIETPPPATGVVENTLIMLTAGLGFVTLGTGIKLWIQRQHQ